MNTTVLDHLCMGCMQYLDHPETPCPVCGWRPGDANQPHQLAPGSILAGKYLVGRVLGQGGFGITYMGWDIPANAKRAIKEYYPSDSVTREGDHYTVTPYTSQDIPQLFAQGRDKFFLEAQNLARFDHIPDVVSIKDFFLENGTAYIVMEFVEGQTFREYLTRLGRPMELADTLALLEPVARSLEQVHAAGLIHRDVSPDNIMLTADGTAKLLDFGAARGFSIQGARTNTVNVKMGYAPDEQYRTHGNQGPWTDVYALAATIYRAITGQVPIQAFERSPTDLLDRPTLLGAKLTPAQEQVLLKGMAVFPEGRYQSVREFYDAMKRSLQTSGTGRTVGVNGTGKTVGVNNMGRTVGTNRAGGFRGGQNIAPSRKPFSQPKAAVGVILAILAIGWGSICAIGGLIGNGGFLFGVTSLAVTLCVLIMLVDMLRALQGKPTLIPSSRFGILRICGIVLAVLTIFDGESDAMIPGMVFAVVAIPAILLLYSTIDSQI